MNGTSITALTISRFVWNDKGMRPYLGKGVIVPPGIPVVDVSGKTSGGELLLPDGITSLCYADHYRSWEYQANYWNWVAPDTVVKTSVYNVNTNLLTFDIEGDMIYLNKIQSLIVYANITGKSLYFSCDGQAKIGLDDYKPKVINTSSGLIPSISNGPYCGSFWFQCNGSMVLDTKFKTMSTADALEIANGLTFNYGMIHVPEGHGTSWYVHKTNSPCMHGCGATYYIDSDRKYKERCAIRL